MPLRQKSIKQEQEQQIYTRRKEKERIEEEKKEKKRRDRELKEEAKIAEQERQEEILTSLKTTRKTKHSTERPPVPSTADTTKVPSPKRPKHSSPQAAKPTEKVRSFSSFTICIVLSYYSTNQFHS